MMTILGDPGLTSPNVPLLEGEGAKQPPWKVDFLPQPKSFANETRQARLIQPKWCNFCVYFCFFWILCLSNL